MIDIAFIYILLGVIPAVLMFVWLNTTAFVEYMCLFNLDQYFYVDDYIEATVDDPATTYTSFIQQRFPNFFTRLIHCPQCLVFWLSGLVHLPIFVAGIVLSPLATILFIIPSILITVYTSLLLYYLLVRMMK